MHISKTEILLYTVGSESTPNCSAAKVGRTGHVRTLKT